MNSKTNRTLFIIIALLGSVKNSHTNSELLKQLAITKHTHVGNPIKGVETFKTPKPLAVLSALDSESKLGHMNNKSADSGLLSDESDGLRPSQEEESPNIPAEETHSTNQTNGSRLGMPSAKKLLYFLIASVLNGRGAAYSPCSDADCNGDGDAYKCFWDGISECFYEHAYDAGCNAGFGESTLISFGVAGGIALGIVGCCLTYRHYQLKKNRSRSMEKDILLDNVQRVHHYLSI